MRKRQFMLDLLRKVVSFRFNSFDAGLELDLITDIPSNKKEKPYWIILKCTKCGAKRIPLITNDSIVPVSKYCKDCGSDKYRVEHKDHIERLDTIYALYSSDLRETRQGSNRHKLLNQITFQNRHQMDPKFISAY